MTFRTRLALSAALLVFPFAAAASAPAAVTGIKAWEENGAVHVSWDKLPDDQNIAYYRIFFAAQSILGNNGVYDDFDIAQAGKTEHTLQGLPAAPTLYFSVLAVNAGGEESPFFAEEAKVDRGAMGAEPAPQAPQAPESQPAEPTAPMNMPAMPTLPTQPANNVELPAGEGMLSLLSAESLSSTGVVLTFSAEVTIAEVDAPSAFTIVDGSGTTLRITRLLIQGNAVTLHTVPQDPTKIYQVRVQKVTGRSADGTVLTLDPTQGMVLFAPFAGATEPTTPTSATPPLPPVVRDVTNLQLRAQSDGMGRYVVEATWDAPADPAAIAQYWAAQTIDHGRTFSQPLALPPAATTVRIPGVPAGEFGILIRTVATNGQASQGVVSYLQLGQGTSPAVPQWTANVTTPGSSDSGLPQSGIGMTAAIGIAGAALGTVIMRRRKVALATAVA